ncbi:hypothetical protein SCP_0104420 [Sparassis crispa]|uniref:BTB domain-containing protein n=1 Tax=Sparassis crispa TaxID=139825 RepID=A0A401G5Z1_9APHY|nr:hypothetical protein SCP_0104420 [Sparassis crispa]GBE77564.1 hypothetical protein SCP_0104420 [Sparassis crispa]
MRMETKQGIISTESRQDNEPVRHRSLYILDDTVVIRVEDTLYRVHRYFLKRHSSVFAGLFDLPPCPDKPVEGSGDETPIHLQQVASIDFERLLSLFYPRNVQNGDLATVDEWTSVLALASKFGFDEFRELAVARLSQIATPVDRIMLSRAYDMTGWLIPAYAELCKRDESLTLQEGLRLGMKDVIMLSHIRQTIRRGSYLTSIRMSDSDILTYIDQQLKL